MKVTSRRTRRFGGRYAPPGDKSITHRAFLMAALSEGVTRVRGQLVCGDTMHLLAALRCLGATVTGDGDGLRFDSPGLDAFVEPDRVLSMGNSGTATRLLAGVLATRPFLSVLTGDASLRSRPMDRIAVPLRMMGAEVILRGGKLAPVVVRGGPLKGIRYSLPVASAQVKSAILFAGLGAEGTVEISEPSLSRDHTERIFASCGITVRTDGRVVRMKGGQRPAPREIAVPGDPSSAAFMIAACLLVGDAPLTVGGVGLNPGRTGYLDALRAMGARIIVAARRELSGEPVGDVTVTPSSLAGIDLDPALIPSMIDEIPVFALVAATARGVTRITGASELRHKETDRIARLVAGLRRLGVAADELPDGLVVTGGGRLQGAVIPSWGDHRMAMTWAVAGLAASGPVEIVNAGVVGTSYPGFFRDLATLSGRAVAG